MWLAVALGTVGTILSLTMVVPQGLVIWRERSLEGISVTAWAVLIVTLSVWLGFTLRTGNLTMVVGNGVALVVCAWIVAGTVRAQHYRASWAWGCLLSFGLGVPAAILIGHALRGAVLDTVLMATALTWLPQVLRSARTLDELRPSDVSRTSLAMGITANTAWTLHGAVKPDVMIGIASFVQVVVILGVLLLETAADRRRTRLVEPVIVPVAASWPALPDGEEVPG